MEKGNQPAIAALAAYLTDAKFAQDYEDYKVRRAVVEALAQIVLR